MLELFIFAFLNFAPTTAWDNPLPQNRALLSLINPAPVPEQKQNTQRPALLDEKKVAIWVMDLQSGKMLFSKDPYRPQPIASLTKIMTFLIIYEDLDLEDVVTVAKKATITEGAQIDLYENEQLTVKTLLEAILIPSANDAARALAIHHSGSEEAFVEEMNKRAKTWGLRTAQFYNSTGLDLYKAPKGEVLETGEEAATLPNLAEGTWYGNQMSAYELARLTQKALRIPFFANTVAKEEFFGTSVDEAFAHSKKSTNQLLGSFLGSRGVKTGFTNLAGQCLIHLSQREDGVQILSVVLGSPDRFQETKNILTWIWDGFVWR